jgi:hypothetical protein
MIYVMAIAKMWGYATILFATTCDYVSFAITFAITYQLHQFCDYIATNVQLLSSSSFYVNASRNVFIHK